MLCSDKHQYTRAMGHFLYVALRLYIHVDEIFDLYNDIQDDFRVIFHRLQKDTFVEYLTDKEYDEYLG